MSYSVNLVGTRQKILDKLVERKEPEYFVRAVEALTENLGDGVQITIKGNGHKSEQEGGFEGNAYHDIQITTPEKL